jgi:hypothetical protein
MTPSLWMRDCSMDDRWQSIFESVWFVDKLDRVATHYSLYTLDEFATKK